MALQTFDEECTMASNLRWNPLRATAIAAALSMTGGAWAQSAAGLDHGASRVSRAEPGRPLTAASRAAPDAIVAGYLRGRGRSDAVLASLSTARSSKGAAGVTHLRLEQTVAGLPVHGAYLKAAVNARGELVQVIDNLAAVSALRPASINAQAAFKLAMAQLHPTQSADLRVARGQGNTTQFERHGFFHRAPEVSAVAIPMSDGTLARGWLVETWTQKSNQLHHTLVGGDGRVLDVELRTASDSYNVFPTDPGKGPQQLVAGPGGGNAESPIGWLVGAQTTLTVSGNNVAAYLDRNDDNLSDGGGSPAGVDFLSAANLATAPTAATNQAVAVQNLFYLNNRIHDILYRHGFNEEAANFQAENFGKGGRGGDPVQAEAQDGGGTDNANFATPGEGKAPRMQMYLWTGAGPTHALQVAGGPGYVASGADFGPALTPTGVSGNVLVTTPADGCTAISTALAGQVALIDRGTCDFSTKVFNAQNAGAAAVVIANNQGGTDTFTMGAGANAANVTIPSLMIGQTDGAALKAALPASATLSKLAVQPLQVDASLDSDIVYHEYCHGLTWRMIGRMSGPLAGAIGEGMADGCALLINSENDVVAEYSASDPRGIRSAPYTDHPRTYGSIGVASGSPQVHFDGEIYAAIVWKMIQDFGAPGRDKLFSYIVDGMNYTPAKPSYEDMRDGILAAVAAGASPSDCSTVWGAFAHYGVGVGAKGSVRGTKVVITESKTAPASCN
jgi:extracellular elastinolytic metalloproteinase